jgi:hypothetical protein
MFLLFACCVKERTFGFTVRLLFVELIIGVDSWLLLGIILLVV